MAPPNRELRSSFSIAERIDRFCVHFGFGRAFGLMLPTESSPGRKFVPELDVLRGIAALAMILNHAGYRLLSAQDATQSGVSALVFFGSFAPAIFFFATGFGIGLSRSAEPRPFDWVGVLWKAALLIVADQFFFWSKGVAWGLDFFSFIAIATLLVSLLSRLRGAVSVCLSLATLLLLTRYGLATVWSPHEQLSPILEWLLGARGVTAISYPLSPWMCFPLMGFACGVAYQGVDLSQRLQRNAWLQRGGLLATVCLVAALGLFLLNRSFFRWGTVSVSFFILAVGVVSAVGLFSVLTVIHGQRFSNALALRGVASFAVIPLHYALLEIVVQWLPQPTSPLNFVFVVASVICITFIGAAKFADLAAGVAASPKQALLFVCSVAAVLLLAFAIHAPAVSSAAPAAAVTLLAQLLVATLLGVRVPSLRKVLR